MTFEGDKVVALCIHVVESGGMPGMLAHLGFEMLWRIAILAANEKNRRALPAVGSLARHGV